MFRLLFCLSALGLVVDAAPTGAVAPATIDFPSCPITYFGKQYTSVQVTMQSLYPSIKFNGEDEKIALPLAAMASLNYEFLDTATITSLSMAAESEFSHLGPTATCGLKISYFRTGGGMLNTHLLNYGTQAAVIFSGAGTEDDEFVFTIGGNSETRRYMSLSVDGSFQKVQDLTGCRDATDAPYLPNDDITTNSLACIFETCQTSGNIEQTPNCLASEDCLSNNICGDLSSCFIVGQSVVDLSVSTGTVPGFCNYKILDSTRDFIVWGNFSDRRFGDVPFLTNVQVNTPSIVVAIAQGSKVTVNGADVTSDLSSTPTVYTDAFVSLDTNGVTVAFAESNMKTTVFYDGTLLDLTHEVPRGVTAYSIGLCGNIAANSKDTSSSDQGCDSFAADARADTINCVDKQTRCTNLLSSLSSPVNSSAFVTACADMLCHYPDQDGIACHFLDAYARASGLSVPAESGCGVSVCVDHICASHEYCVVKPNGDAGCFCRGRDSDISRFKESQTYGEDAMCDADSASLTLYTCFLEENGINPNGVHLNSVSCTGVYNNSTHMVTLSFDSTDPCGGTLVDQNSEIVFSNNVLNSQGLSVVFENQLNVTFSCTYTQPSEPLTASFRILDGSLSVTYESGSYTFTLVLGLFTDSGFSDAVTSSSELQLGEEVFVRVDGQDIGGTALGLVIENCWTTSEVDPTGANHYDLITDKCSAHSDGTVTLMSSGQSLVSDFRFDVYENVASTTSSIYLHCQVSLCVLADGCVPTCGGI